MSINVVTEIFIKKSPEEVANFLFNPKMDTRWLRELSGVYPMQSGLYSKGDRIERVGVFLKKAYSAKVVVTNVLENKSVELYSDEPFEMKIKYEIAPKDDGTNVKYSISSISDIPFNNPIKTLNEIVSSAMTEDIERLRKHIEDDF
ncbi:MAG: SRPBCC family protein [Pyrinomonadaceae bacterium]